MAVLRDSEDRMADDPNLTNFLVDQARVSEHVRQRVES